jgi:hypothetical protein
MSPRIVCATGVSVLLCACATVATVDSAPLLKDVKTEEVACVSEQNEQKKCTVVVDGKFDLAVIEKEMLGPKDEVVNTDEVLPSVPKNFLASVNHLDPGLSKSTHYVDSRYYDRFKRLCEKTNGFVRKSKETIVLGYKVNLYICIINESEFDSAVGGKYFFRIKFLGITPYSGQGKRYIAITSGAAEDALNKLADQQRVRDEADREIKQAPARQEYDDWYAASQRLLQQLKPGDTVFADGQWRDSKYTRILFRGMVVEVKPPLALVQFPSGVQWLKIEQLFAEPPKSFYCSSTWRAEKLGGKCFTELAN